MSNRSSASRCSSTTSRSFRCACPRQRAPRSAAHRYLRRGRQAAGKSKVNPAEAKIIVDEIEKIIDDPALSHFGGDRSRPRSIGVISADRPRTGGLYSARTSWSRRRRRACSATASPAATAPPSRATSATSSSCRWLPISAQAGANSDQYEQRFNVALSRARDRLFLVRSVTENDLNPKDIKARVLAHFREPMPAPMSARR